MTIGTSNIRMSQIQTEFGGSNPIRMSEYYAGGDNVNSTQPNVPSSGLIEISDFSGAQNTAQFSATMVYVSSYGITGWLYSYNDGGADTGSISPQRCLLRNKWEGDDGTVSFRNHPITFRLSYSGNNNQLSIWTPSSQAGNSGFTSIYFYGKAGGSTNYAITFNRSAANYTTVQTSNGYTQELWTWSGNYSWGGTGSWVGTIKIFK